MNKKMVKKLTLAAVITISLFAVSVTPRGVAATAATVGEPAKDDSAAAAEITLDALIKEALKNSPVIKMARYRWGARIEKVPQVGSLPNPMISYTYFPEPIETKLGPNDHRYMLSQMVPYPEKLSLKEELAGYDAKVEELSYKMDIREVITALSESYFELLYIQKAIEITRQNKDLLLQLTKIATADYAADSTTLSDVLTAQSQLAQLNYDYLLLLELRETEVAKINSILDRPPSSEIGRLKDISLKLPYELKELYDLTADTQEEIKMIDVKIDKMRTAEKLAKLSYYPDFKVELLYSQINAPDGMQPDDAGRDAYAIKIGATIPIWFKKNDSMIREKMMKKKQMVQMKKARVNMTNSMVKNLYFRVNNSKRLMDLYAGSLIPQAETTMAKAEEWYKQKHGSFAQVLETQSVWLNFNLAYQRAAADHNKYTIKLQNLIGIDLIDGSDAKAER